MNSAPTPDLLTAAAQGGFAEKFTGSQAENVLKNPDWVIAERCRRSLFTFMQEFWDEIISETPIWNWHMALLCREVQSVIMRVVQNKPAEYDLVANVPPGTSKSTIFVQMAPAWAWASWPSLRFICGSYSGDLALDHAGLCRDIIVSEKYTRLFPQVQLRKDKAAASYFKTTKGGSRFATSVGGTVTGIHAHVILIDDPINPHKVASALELKRANKWLGETLSTRKVNKAITPTILVMQRLHEEDPSGYILEKIKDGKKVRHICLPGECKRFNVIPAHLKRYYKNDLLDPQRMNWDVLMQMRIDLGEYGYAGQIGQTPAPPGGGMFKVSKFNIVDDMPEGRINKIIRYWDKSGTSEKEDRRAPRTAGIRLIELVTTDKKTKYVVTDAVVGRWEPFRRESIIAAVADSDGCETKVWMEQEPGSGGKESAMRTIENLKGTAAYADRVTGDKVYRADPWSVQVNLGNVYLLRGEWNKEFISEHAMFPNSRFKDQVDAAAGAYAKLAKKGRAGAW